MLSKKVVDLIEEYLYIYPHFDEKIQNIKEEAVALTTKDINSWIRSKGRKSSGVEYQAIINLLTEEKINYCLKWEKVINKVMKIFKEHYPESYSYVTLRYQEKCSITKIQHKSCMSKSTQGRLKKEIMYYIAIFAYKENLIKMEENYDEKRVNKNN